MDKTTFLTIFRTFGRPDIVKQTLPAVIAETQRNDARLIVHDATDEGREEKWQYLQELNRNHDFFLILSSNLASAHVVNMCLQLGQELFSPDYICVMEDDHGYREGIIPVLVQAMREKYGKTAPNGLRYGLFTACADHNGHIDHRLEDGDACPSGNQDVSQMGRANACFRCAPANHWNNVLKGFDPDEYLISNYQVMNLNRRNYYRGFTSLLLQEGQYCFFVEGPGRGAADKSGYRRWDATYTASDPRSRFRGKKGGDS